MDAAYVAMAVHLCCKRLFPMFHLIFQTYVISVFIWMLHMLHTYVANILSRCYISVALVFKCFMCFFASVSDAGFKRFICFHTYVANVVSRYFKSRSSVASLSSSFVVSLRCLLFLMLVMFGRPGPAWGRTAWVGHESFEWCGTRASGACSTEQARSVGSSVWMRS
jgi:hypothetical protein